MASLGLALTAPAQPAVQAAGTGVPALSHVFVIVMENHSYNEIVGSPSAPYVNSLLASGGLATNYYAVTHPSLPNYLALAAGTTFGITSDCTTCWINGTSVADSIEAAGKTWKSYEESMPYACYVGDSYPYVQKHDPFLYFNNIRNNASRCQSHIVPYSQLSSDLASAATTPSFGFITPNACSDMHDCSVSTGDTWLSQNVPQILRSPAFTTQQSVLAIVWDEDDFSGTNQVAEIMVGSGVTPGLQTSINHTHYSLLHTVEAGLGLGTLTSNDAGWGAMSDFFGLAGWSNVGGIGTSSAAPSASGATRTDVFVRGTDGGLWQRTWSGASWGGWQPLGGIVTANPAAVSSAANRIDVFVRGTDDGLWQQSWNGTTWTGWTSLGGILTSGAAVASQGAGTLDVFVRGTDGGLWHKSWNGSQWTQWQSLGGILTSDPAAVSWGSGRLDVFVRGTDNGLWQISWNGQTWSGWTPLGGWLSSGPAASSCAAGHLDVFVAGSDQAIYQRGFNGQWSGWGRIGGYWTSDPGAVCPTGTASVSLFEVAPNQSVVQSTATGS